MTSSSASPPRRFQFTVRHLLVLTLVVALALGIGRWMYFSRPWLYAKHGGVLVAESEVGEDSMLVEYRMREPFKIALVHVLRERAQYGPVVGLPEAVLRSEVVSVFSSKYDFVRGHFVRLRVSTGGSLAIEANGTPAQVVPWSVPDVCTQWNTWPEGHEICNGCGVELVEIAANKGSREVIDVYSGTDIPEYILKSAQPTDH